MAESLQPSFQRFHISQEELLESSSASPGNNSNNNNNSGLGSTIPILDRTNEAKSHSLKLREISPICVLVVGMAGSGKTTLMAALQRSLTTGNVSDGQEDEGGDEEKGEEGESHIEDNTKEETEGDESEESVNESSRSNDHHHHHHHAPIGYCLNLDPATKLVPFGASIDIRDTVDYKVGFFEFYFCNHKYHN